MAGPRPAVAAPTPPPVLPACGPSGRARNELQRPDRATVHQAPRRQTPADPQFRGKRAASESAQYFHRTPPPLYRHPRVQAVRGAASPDPADPTPARPEPTSPASLG